MVGFLRFALSFRRVLRKFLGPGLRRGDGCFAYLSVQGSSFHSALNLVSSERSSAS